MKANTRTGVSREDLSKFTYLLALALRPFSFGREEKPRFSVLLILFHESINTTSTKSSDYRLLNGAPNLVLSVSQKQVTLRSLFLCPYLRDIFPYSFSLSTLGSSLARSLITQTTTKVYICRLSSKGLSFLSCWERMDACKGPDFTQKIPDTIVERPCVSVCQSNL